jgi:hypothetical protein
MCFKRLYRIQCCYDTETGNTDPHSGKEAEKKMAHKMPPEKVPFEVQMILQALRARTC